MKLFKYLFIVTLLSVTTFSFAQNGTIRGNLFDNKSGEPVIYTQINLYNSNNEVQQSVTDIDGFFSFPKLSQGNYRLVVDNDFYAKLEEKVAITGAGQIVTVQYKLKEPVDETLDKVVISGQSTQRKTKTNVSEINFSKKDVERIPSQGGEPDVLTAFSVTPGVVTTGDQGGQLYVRGGTPIQNRILLDGMTIYTPFHSIGFFSIFESELIKNVDIYTGGFEAKYGGRISSVMDITYRDGNRNKFGGKISASPFMGKLVLEGPLRKKSAKGTSELSNTSFILSAKHSLLPYTSKALYRKLNGGNGLPFSFTDVYGKLTVNTDGGTKFNVFGFYNTDSVNYYNAAALKWNQGGGGVSFNIVPTNSPVLIKGYINGSYFGTHFTEAGASAPRKSSIGGGNIGFDFTYFQKHQSQIDAGILLSAFNTNYETTNEIGSRIAEQNFSFELSLFANYRIVYKRFIFQPGFRLQAYASRSTISPEPRLAIKYNANEFLRFKVSGGRYSQNFTSSSSDKDVVNLFNGLLSAPQNFQQTFTMPNGKVRVVKNALQFAWHAVGGFELDLGKYVTIDIEGYYKYFNQLSNINQNKQYNDEAQFDDVPDELKKNFIIESGRSYGVDFLTKFQKDRMFLWVTYSLSKSQRYDGFTYYFPVFDRRHNINVVASYQFLKKKDLELSIRWNFGSGLPFTPTAGAYQNETFKDGVTTDYTKTNTDDVTLIMGKFNSERLPAYHRLDVTIKKNFTFKNASILELNASVTNAYNRKNIFYVNRVTNQVIYQFPIMPSFGVSYKF
jgi:hypothetical protein